jgi:hypothetical protein
MCMPTFWLPELASGATVACLQSFRSGSATAQHSCCVEAIMKRGLYSEILNNGQLYIQLAQGTLLYLLTTACIVPFTACICPGLCLLTWCCQPHHAFCSAHHANWPATSYNTQQVLQQSASCALWQALSVPPRRSWDTVWPTAIALEAANTVAAAAAAAAELDNLRNIPGSNAYSSHTTQPFRP